MITSEIYTTDGNVVKKIEQPLPDRQTRAKEKAYEKRKNERNRYHQQLVHKYQLRLNFICFSLIALFFCFILLSYVSLLNSINNHMNKISQLEQEISTVKSYNDSLQSKIDLSENNDLVSISNYATEQLGMVPATGHIIYYSFDKQDFMTQY